MLILEERDLTDTGIDWHSTIAVIEDAVRCLEDNDFSQPVKPYLRYRDLKNRIIAMPAFVGGNINMAGVKWIASFPGNIKKGIPRAHSVVVLNDADTGEPVGIINTALLSVIRTASVSGMVIKRFNSKREMNDIRIGITGFGPIGRYHLKMCQALLGDRITSIRLFDLQQIDVSGVTEPGKIEVVSTWEEAYTDADIFITCTVSDAPYIDKRPKPGSLHLNVSLRDYKTSVYEWFKDAIIVDNWEEVCRERTDIEMLHQEKGLQKENTRSITDVLHDDCWSQYNAQSPVMFNPMGMAVFDIAIGNYYYQAACGKKNVENHPAKQSLYTGITE